LIVLGPLLDMIPNETNLRKAKVLVGQMKARSLPLGNSFTSRMLIDFFANGIKHSTDVLAEARTSAMTRAEIIKSLGCHQRP